MVTGPNIFLIIVKRHKAVTLITDVLLKQVLDFLFLPKSLDSFTVIPVTPRVKPLGLSDQG